MPKQSDEKKAQDAQWQELQDLWRRRDRLNESEWEQLYKLVGYALSHNSGSFGSLIKNLPEDFDFYFEDFFVQKVFLEARKEGFDAPSLEHSGVLPLYFKRFLLDQADKIKRRPQPLEFPEEEHEERESILDLLLATSQHPDWPDPDWRPSPEQEWLLWDIGLDLPTVTASAKDFFNRLAPEDRLLFEECYVEKKPLSDLQGRVKNVYDKAAELGIKLRKGEKKYVDYCKTRIGKWLASLGLYLDRRDRDPKRPHDPDKLKVLFIVLQILRACALDGVEAERRSGSGPDDPPPAAGPSVAPR